VSNASVVEASSCAAADFVCSATDSATKAVAQNNAILVQKSENPYVKQRHVQLIQTPEPPNRLFEFQASTLRRNRYTIELQCQKFNGVKSSTSSTLAKSPDRRATADCARLGVLGAAAQAELKLGKDALRAILPSLEARPDDVGLLLTVMQLCIQTQNPERALELLETFFKRLELATKPDDADVRFAPGLVALAVGLYRLTGRTRAIRTELRKAAAHWRQRESPDGVGDTLLRQAGAELLQSSKPADLETAGASFEALVASRPDDKLASAGMVASFATSNAAKANQHLSGLPSPAQLTVGIDVESLIASGVPHAPTPAPIGRTSTKRKRVAVTDPAQDAPPASATASRAQQQQARKKRRNNKPRLPKDHDPDMKPDPERWLPLRDRSSYRPKGRKGKKRAAEATQGGLVRDGGEAHETLELVGGAGAVRVEKTGAGSTSAAGGGGSATGGVGGNGGGGGKKKGKKGKK
jgi:signal recognition particle subunit SRP72